MKTTQADRKSFMQGYQKRELPPPGGSGEKLSARHHRETIEFDLTHAQDHIADAEKHKKALRKLQRRGSAKRRGS